MAKLLGGNCEHCGKFVEDYDPQYCCNAFDCGCMGRPTVPCFCSQECSDKYDQMPRYLADGNEVDPA